MESLTKRDLRILESIVEEMDKGEQMGPLEEIRKQSLMQLVDALRPFVDFNSPEGREAKRLVELWDHAFKVWGW